MIGRGEERCRVVGWERQVDDKRMKGEEEGKGK